MKVKSVPVKFKAGPDDGLAEGQFVVYPSTFTRSPDAYGDVVAKGAFTDTIRQWEESGNVLPGLYGHRMDDPDFFIAAATKMAEDEHGWRVEGEFDLEAPKGRTVYRLVKGRRLNQLSFAYDVVEEARVELDDGQKANELRKVRVHEFSFVPVGANPDTSVVAVKSAVEALAKAGRVLSSKNESALREARDSIDSVLSSLGDEEDGNAQGKASGDAEAKPGASGESKPSASGEEPKAGGRPSTYLAVISIEERI